MGPPDIVKPNRRPPRKGGRSEERALPYEIDFLRAGTIFVYVLTLF